MELNDQSSSSPFHLHTDSARSMYSLGAVTLVFPNFYPSPCHTSSHIPGPPESTSHISDPPVSKRPSTKNLDKPPLYKFCFNCSRRFFSGAFVRGFLSGRFCPGWFLSVPVLSEYICYIRKLNITLNFIFRMHDKKIKVCDVTCSLPPPLSPSQTVTPSRTPY